MGNRLGKKRDQVQVDLSKQDCFICMEQVDNLDIIKICKNNHYCCIDCKKQLYTRYCNLTDDNDADLDSQCPYCREDNYSYLIDSYSPNSNQFEDYLIHRTYQMQSIINAVEGLKHIEKNCKRLNKTTQKILTEVYQQYQTFTNNYKDEIPNYLTPSFYYYDAIEIHYELDEEYSYIKDKPINKWKMLDIQHLVSYLQYSIQEDIREIRSF